MAFYLRSVFNKEIYSEEISVLMIRDLFQESYRKMTDSQDPLDRNRALNMGQLECFDFKH